MTTIQTYTGKTFDLANPDPDLIDIVDIAHALSMICRFTGHVREFDSVAQHSLVVAEMLPPHLQLVGLMHDATEAYVTDVSRPLKGMLPAYKEIEDSVWRAIATRFDLPETLPPEVKAADNVSLLWERRDLMGASTEKWDLETPDIAARIPAGRYIPLQPVVAKYAFLARFHELMDRSVA